MANGFTTPKTIKERAEKIWLKGDLHKAHLTNTELFPLTIALPNLSAKELLTEFSQLQNSLHLLRQDSVKNGYSIENKPINHRQLGEQKIPAAIIFNTENQFLRYLGKNQEFAQFKTLTEQTLARYPNLRDWLTRYPFRIMNFSDNWNKLLSVCDYFIQHPKPDCYVRQLDIADVDTKFIEQHKGILSELLDQLLSESARDLSVTGLSNHGFERRYGLRYEQPQIRLRILDQALAIHGVTDLTLTLSEFQQLELPVKTVFISENKMNGLATPDFPDALVIFGLGYAVDLLAQARCLQTATIYYWGDLDTHGFAILSRMRGYFPSTHSLLMDNETLQTFKKLWVAEPKSNLVSYELANLTADEQQVFQYVKSHNIRLEQERISYSYFLNALNNIKQLRGYEKVQVKKQLHY
jgi:hypothetical protein